ncbi:hypothetical protein MKW92_024994 [Papaver armeniacum]|nr:hypothetical protein MKW92_024994 [Papaver armeniacum]
MANPQIRCWFSQMKKLFLMTDEGLQKLFVYLHRKFSLCRCSSLLDAAIFLFSLVANILTESLDGTKVHGQNQILHLLDLFNLLTRYFTILSIISTLSPSWFPRMVKFL